MATFYEDRISSLSPVIWFKFDEAAGGNAVSSGSKTPTATAYNGVLAGQTSTVSNQCVTYDGSNDHHYYITGSTSAHQFSGMNDGVFTIEFWIKGNGSSISTTNNQVVFNHWDTNDLNRHIGGYVRGTNYANTGKFTYYTLRSSAGYQDTTSTSRVDDGKFHHIVIAQNGNTTKMYVDGVLETTKTDWSWTTFGWDANASVKTIFGAGVSNYSTNATTEHYAGSLDEYAIYGSELSALQIKQNYNSKFYGKAYDHWVSTTQSSDHQWQYHYLNNTRTTATLLPNYQLGNELVGNEYQWDNNQNYLSNYPFVQRVTAPNTNTQSGSEIRTAMGGTPNLVLHPADKNPNQYVAVAWKNTTGSTVTINGTITLKLGYPTNNFDGIDWWLQREVVDGTNYSLISNGNIPKNTTGTTTYTFNNVSVASGNRIFLVIGNVEYYNYDHVITTFEVWGMANIAADPMITSSPHATMIHPAVSTTTGVVNVNYNSGPLTADATSPNATWSAETVINNTYASGVLGTADSTLVNPTISGNATLDAFGVSAATSDFINPVISVISNIDYSHTVLTASATSPDASISTTRQVAYSASPITVSALFGGNVFAGPTVVDSQYHVSIRQIRETENLDGKNGFIVGSQWTDSTLQGRFSLAMKPVTGVPTNGALIKVKINNTDGHVTLYAPNNRFANAYNIYVFTANPSTTFDTMNYTNLPAKELITTTRAEDSDQQYLDLTQAFRDSRAASYGIFIEHVGEPPYSGTVYDRTEYNGTNLEDKVLYILTSEFVHINYNAAPATATATNTDVSVYVERYINISASPAIASADSVTPNVGTENTVTVSAMTTTASSQMMMPAFGSTVSYTPDHLEAHSEMLGFIVSAQKQVNIAADVTTVSALIEMPEAQIGEDNIVSHMDASALFVMPLVYIPNIVSAMVTTATADIVNPSVTVETKGKVAAAPMLARNAFLVEPPAYINKNADMWYRTLLAQDTVNYPPTADTYFGVFAAQNVDIAPVDNTISYNSAQTPWSGKQLKSDLGPERYPVTWMNQYQTGLTTPIPKLEVGYFDNKNRRAVRFNNIAFGDVNKNTTSVGRNYSFTTELIFKTTKQNQIILHGYSDLPDRPYYAGTRSAIGLYNGKLYMSRSFSGLPQYDNVHPLNSIYGADTSAFTFGTINVADGEWHHITLQYGGDITRFQIWVDGQLDVQRYNQGHNVPNTIGYNSGDSNYYSDFYLSGFSIKPNLFIDQSTIYKHYLAYEQYDPVKAAPMVGNASAGNNSTAKGNRPRALMLYWFPVETEFNRVSDQGRYGEFDFETFDNLLTTDKPGSPPQKYYGWDVFPVDIQGFHQSDIIKSSAWGLGGVANGFRDPKTDNRRYVDLLNDLDLSQFDTIFFRNYPDQSPEMDAYTRNESVDTFFGIIEKDLYEKFLVDLRKAVDTGISLYVTNTKLALDLGIVDRIEIVPDMHEGTTSQDLRSVALIGTQPTGGARGYNDTHKNNFITLRNTLAGLTDHPSYIHKDAAWWKNDDRFDFGGADKEYQKYEWKPNGLGVGDTFMISDDYLYGGGRNLQAAPIANIKAGKAITTFAPTVWSGNQEITNPYANHAVHIAVEPGDVLQGKQLGGKIFVSFTERFNGAQSYIYGPQYQYASKDHGQVELTTDYWINRAYDTGYIDLARKNYLLNYEGNLDRQIEAANIAGNQAALAELNKIKYWSVWGENIIAQQNVNISNIMLTSNAQGNEQATNKATNVINPATGTPIGWRQEVFFTFRYSQRYPRMVIDVPSMMTRGFWWLANRVFLEGQVQRPVSFTSNAEIVNPTVSTVKILSVNVQAMVANATIVEATGYSPKDASVSALPMNATGIITQPARVVLALPMTATADFKQNSSILTSSVDEVVLYVYHTDPILYLREEVIK